MGEAGHKVIVADADPTFGLNMTRFSKYVHKFILLNNAKTYVEDLITIYKEEKADGFIPISHIHLSISDAQGNEILLKLEMVTLFSIKTNKKSLKNSKYNYNLDLLIRFVSFQRLEA